MMAFPFIGIALLALAGFVIMSRNFVEEPKDNDSGPSGTFGRQHAEYHPSVPPENSRLMKKSRRWWEI